MGVSAFSLHQKRGRPFGNPLYCAALYYIHILIRSKRISPLRRRAKGFAIIVAPLSTSAFGGLATGEPSPFAILRSAPL